MAYVTSDYSNYIGAPSDFKLSKSQIEEIEMYVKQEEYETKKHERMLKLLEAERVRVIRANVHYAMFSCINFNKAQKWLSMRKDKSVDKRKSHEEKVVFNLLEQCVSREFFEGNPIEIKEIIQCGFEGYGWGITVNYSDVDFVIQIPVLSNVSVKNIDLANFCKIYLGYHGAPHCIDLIISSYVEEDIANAIKDFLERKSADE